MDYEGGTLLKVDMVASLQSRKERLEADLKKKNEELKKLCIEEAELTGTLPPETPLEAGESPPSFRRRVGTVYKYPENLVNKVKSKEEEDALELELATVSNLVKAARGLASNATNKGMKRHYKLQYLQNLERQQELEVRLKDLRQVSRCPPKQRKKPRPPLETEVDGGVVGESVNGISLSPGPGSPSPVQDKLSQREVTKHTAPQPQPPRYTHTGPPLHNYNRNSHRQVQPEASYPPNWNYQQQHRASHDQQGGKYRGDSNNWYNTAPTSRYLGVGNKMEDEERDKSMRYRDRFGSLDRRRGGGGGSSVDAVEPELRHSPVHRMYPPGSGPPPPPPPTILLPNQTYPENSLMRTHSLGMVDHTSRKCKEKDWYETSLDAGPRPSPTPPPRPHTPSPAPAPAHTSGSSTRSSEADSADQVHMPVTQQLSFDTVVPFESPKNHTVVQAGMWQPYREVTKPFEMADFYKYSTKFRKNMSGAPPVPQQKAPYQPPQPMTCQPLATQESSSDMPSPREKSTPSEPSLADAFSNEMLSWYQDSSAPQPRSATLV